MTPEAIRSLCKAVAILAVVFGAGGMFLCVPFLLGIYVPVIAAVSLPFIAGAILVGSGLISCTLLLNYDHAQK